MPKQIKFYDIENDCLQAGILLDNGDCICACCGGVFEASDMGEQWEILFVFEEWSSFRDALIG